MSGRPTQFASKTGVGTTGRFLCSNDAEQRRPPGSKRCETKVRMVWGVFLLLQQRSKHPREMVTTPKASTLKLAWHVKKKTGRTHTHDKTNTTPPQKTPPTRTHQPPPPHSTTMACQMCYLPQAEGVLLHAFENRSRVCG